MAAAPAGDDPFLRAPPMAQATGQEGALLGPGLLRDPPAQAPPAFPTLTPASPEQRTTFTTLPPGSATVSTPQLPQQRPYGMARIQARVGAQYKAVTSEITQGIDMLQVFPTMFTMLIVGMFIAPLIAIAQMDNNASVRYWIGRWCLLAYVPIPIFIVTHFVHSLKSIPDRSASIVSMFVPSLLLFILSEVVSVRASMLAFQLGVNDCTTFAPKRDLDNSLIMAKSMWSECVKQADAAKLRIPSYWACADVQNADAHIKNNWEYLAQAELEFNCGGWCTADRMFWMQGKPFDSCARAVSQDLWQVADTATKVAYLSLFLFIVLVAFFIRMGPMLDSRGIKW